MNPEDKQPSDLNENDQPTISPEEDVATASLSSDEQPNEAPEPVSNDSTIDESIAEPQEPQLAPMTAMPKKTSHKKLLVIVLTVLLLAAAAVGVWFVFGKKDSTSDTSSTQSSDVESVARLGVAVTLIDGTAEYSEDMSAWTPLTTDTELKEGNYIRAMEASRVVLTLDDGSAVRLGAASTVYIDSLEAENIVIRSEGGETYSRVVASDTRSYVVSVGGSSYTAKGTAFRTYNTDAKKGVEVFHSAVEVNSDKTVSEGSALYETNSDPAKVGVVIALDVEALKDDEFIKWNAEQDKKQTEFTDKLGVLVDIDKPKATPEPAPAPAPSTSSKPAGITLSGAQDGFNANFSWSVNAIDTTGGYKLVRSKTNSKPTFPDNSVSYISASKTSHSLFVGDGETYYYRICAYKDGKCSTYSNSVQVATTKKQKPIVEAGAVTLSINGSTASWTFAGTAPNGFKLVMSTTSELPVYPADSKEYVSGTSVAIPNKLDPGTYTVRVCKYTGDGCQDYSNPVTHTKN